MSAHVYWQTAPLLRSLPERLHVVSTSKSLIAVSCRCLLNEQLSAGQTLGTTYQQSVMACADVVVKARRPGLDASAPYADACSGRSQASAASRGQPVPQPQGDAARKARPCDGAAHPTQPADPAAADPIADSQLQQPDTDASADSDPVTVAAAGHCRALLCLLGGRRVRCGDAAAVIWGGIQPSWLCGGEPGV